MKVSSLIKVQKYLLAGKTTASLNLDLVAISHLLKRYVFL